MTNADSVYYVPLMSFVLLIYLIFIQLYEVNIILIIIL